jgi:hypothetical protein
MSPSIIGKMIIHTKKIAINTPHINIDKLKLTPNIIGTINPIPAVPQMAIGTRNTINSKYPHHLMELTTIFINARNLLAS